jgi:hypothetical protein
VGRKEGRKEWRTLIRFKNSALVLSMERKQPSMEEVTVTEPGFCTPRIVMHM